MSTCPDTDLYSAYVDGEVPSPWKEKLESHIASCPRCRNRVERYRRIALCMHEELAPAALDMEASFARLSARMSARLGMQTNAHAGAFSGARVFSRHGMNAASKAREWIRYSVKLPVAGLAAMFLAAIFLPSIAVIGLVGRRDDSAQLAASSGNDAQRLNVIAPTSDVYSTDLATNVSSSDPQFTVVDYAKKFSANDELFSDADIIIIKLPKLTNFSEEDGIFTLTGDKLPLASGYNR
jgi:Putative zinc-finger